MKTESTENKIKALAGHLGCEASEIEQSKHNENLFEYGRGEYLVCTDEEADRECEDYIRDSVWAFNASFICSMCDLPSEFEDGIKLMQEKCESANEPLLALIKKTCGLQAFVIDAISADGRGHFLSSYDGEENEHGDYFIYRVN